MPNPVLPTGPGMTTHPQTPVLTGVPHHRELPIQCGIRGPYAMPEGSHTHGVQTPFLCPAPLTRLDSDLAFSLPPNPLEQAPGAGGSQCRQTGNGTGEAGRRRGAAEKFLKFSVLDSWNKSHFLWSPCRVEDWLGSAAARPPPSHVPSPPASLPLSRGIRASAWASQPWGDSRGKRRGAMPPLSPPLRSGTRRR